VTIQRVLISADLEGTAGVVASEELRPGNAEYDTARRLMTAEVNAAVRGIRAANGSADIVVADSHGTYRNLLIEQLNPKVPSLDKASMLGIAVVRAH
jgi:D-amino peptidase